MTAGIGHVCMPEHSCIFSVFTLFLLQRIIPDLSRKNGHETEKASCPCFLYNCFKNSFVPDLNGLCPDLLALIEMEAQQTALADVINKE